MRMSLKAIAAIPSPVTANAKSMNNMPKILLLSIWAPTTSRPSWREVWWCSGMCSRQPYRPSQRRLCGIGSTLVTQNCREVNQQEVQWKTTKHLKKKRKIKFQCKIQGKLVIVFMRNSKQTKCPCVSFICYIHISKRKEQHPGRKAQHSYIFQQMITPFKAEDTPWIQTTNNSAE